MVASIPTSEVAKGVGLWILTMLPTLLTFVTRDFTINIILLVVITPLMISFFSKMGQFSSIKTSIIGIASLITFFILYAISKAQPKFQEGIANPGENRNTSALILVAIITSFTISMFGAAAMFPMYNVVQNTTSAAVNNF